MAEPVKDPGSIFDHVFRLAAALRAQNWSEAFRLALDVFKHLNEPMQLGAAPMFAGGTENNPEALAAKLEAACGQFGGQPGTSKKEAAVQAIDWGNFFKTVLPLVLQALAMIFQQPAPTPGPQPVQTG